ncbi:uncharacterized protein LODBEIA_P02150 [Lodderomyces beijingensis]|uniref:non-specific serine/threonine protein kinase n=1 Tax=Lodderomyces beijingensis TaxID=1775926 RepID=A0ABP0ZFP7_9ASCO
MSHSRQGSIGSSIESTSHHNHPQTIGPWKLGKTLGRGATGRVLLATNQATGQKAAVKVVSKSELHDDEQTTHDGGDSDGLPYGIEREIIIMKLLNHPNVLRLYDVWETSKALYLVLEYVEGGELFDLLVERGPLQEAEAIKYFRQIILGTAYCHALGICHRDLKPENLLLDAQLNVKLADFGMAALESNDKLLETSCGSPHYAAPEIVSGLRYHGAASDVWSCGVILFALLTGRLPFDDENIRNLLLKVQAGNYEMPVDEISKDAQDLIAKMLDVDPKTRISTEKILKHRLLTKYPCPNEDLISERSLPHPETAHKSLGSTKNIDKQILSNLSILWKDRTEDEIIKALLRSGPNSEKTFYALLMRYRHSSDDFTGETKRSASVSNKMKRSGSVVAGKNPTTPRKRRASQINVSRPSSFQYRNGQPGIAVSHNAHNRPIYSRISASSSVNNSPRKSPKRRPNYDASPRGSPAKRQQQVLQSNSNSNSNNNNSAPARTIPANIYNEIVDAQSTLSIPPTLPSKDSYYLDKGSEQPQTAADRSSTLLQSAKISPSKRASVMSRATKKSSKRKSIRASMAKGLMKNSITMKLLSTYAKMATDNEWEHMDKQTKRTSATFAALCDKIFNQEEYNEDDEQLIDPEEIEAREYERLMEIERRKHEAELKARKELEKKKKRQSRRSILSSKKLSILIRSDEDPNNSEQELNKLSELKQPKKRQSKNMSALRALSEGDGVPTSRELTLEEVENLKRRSASQPVPTRRQTPILTRRPVSKLDPLWQAHHNAKIERAHDALEREWHDSKRGAHDKANDKAKVNRQSVVSIMDDIAEEEVVPSTNKLKKRVTRDSYYETKCDYELPEPDLDDPSLMGDVLPHARRSGKGDDAFAGQERELKTLISGVKIPNVTRKSRNFTNSNQRMSVLSLYSTRGSYMDLNSIIDAHRPEETEERMGLPGSGLRTSFADRLDKAGMTEQDEEDVEIDGNSVMDFEEHLAKKRYSYYDANEKRASRASTTRRYSTSYRPTSKVPDLPSSGEHNETFASKSEDVNKGHYKSMLSDASSTDDVFDKIKLPEGKSSISSIDASANGVSKANNGKISSNKQVQSSQNGSHNPQPPIRNSKPEPRLPDVPPKNTKKKSPLDDKTNNYGAEKDGKSSFFRKLSWGSKKSTDPAATAHNHPPTQTATATEHDEEKHKPSFLRWFSSSSASSSGAGGASQDSELRKFHTILPKEEMTSALIALLKSWSNFGLKDLKHDPYSSCITGSISKHNSFDLKSCKFRIRLAPRSRGEKSEIICTRVKGSAVTTETLFNEIEKVLHKEGVIDQ